jgi:hypothetical protein
MSTIDYLRLFKVRKATFAELLRLSESQWDLIVDDNYEGLLDVLGAKQRLLGRMEELTTAYPAIVDRWRGARDALESTVRHECEQLLETTERILGQLNERERHCGTELERRRNLTRGELQRVTGGMEAAGAYHDSTAPSTSRLLDVSE